MEEYAEQQFTNLLSDRAVHGGVHVRHCRNFFHSLNWMNWIEENVFLSVHQPIRHWLFPPVFPTPKRRFIYSWLKYDNSCILGAPTRANLPPIIDSLFEIYQHILKKNCWAYTLGHSIWWAIARADPGHFLRGEIFFFYIIATKMYVNLHISIIGGNFCTQEMIYCKREKFFYFLPFISIFRF